MEIEPKDSLILELFGIKAGAGTLRHRRRVAVTSCGGVGICQWARDGAVVKLREQ